MIGWTSLIFILWRCLTPVLCCDWLSHYGHLSNTSLTLIKLMGGEMTEEDSPVSFPYKLYKHIKNAEVESQLIFIRDNLELMAGLYRHDNRSVITWDTDKTENFLMTIDSQIDGLNGCVSTNRRDSRLRKYYRRLEKCTLYRTGGSPASWELIRKESERHLVQLDHLVEVITASRRRSTQQQH